MGTESDPLTARPFSHSPPETQHCYLSIFKVDLMTNISWDSYVLLEPQVCVLSTLVGSMNRNLDLNLRFCLGSLLFENTSSTTWSADCLNLN